MAGLVAGNVALIGCAVHCVWGALWGIGVSFRLDFCGLHRFDAL